VKGNPERSNISVVIIAQDEEENLPACLESASFADEIVLCDGGSSDETVKIAHEYGANVVFRPFDGFSNQKNYAIEQAKGPWILSLDADERVTLELREEIEAILIASAPVADGYRFPRKGYFGKKWVRHGGWWPDYNLRLFLKGKGLFVDRQVHECVQVQGSVNTLKGALEHHTYRDISDYLLRMDRYSTLAAQQAYNDGKHAYLTDLMVRPVATFLRMYLFRTGFLDGYMGLQLAVLYAVYTFSKYAKLKELTEAR